MGREWKAADVARNRGVSVDTARRQLKALHEKYGDAIVTRRGTRGDYVTSPDALAKVLPMVADRGPVVTQLTARVAELEERLEEQARRHDALVREFRAKSHAQFMKGRT